LPTGFFRHGLRYPMVGKTARWPEPLLIARTGLGDGATAAGRRKQDSPSTSSSWPPSVREWSVWLGHVFSDVVRSSLRPFQGMYFFTVHGDLVGGGDAEAHLAAYDGDDGNAERAADDKSFTDLAREHEHAFLPANRSEECAGRTRQQEPYGVASS